MTTTLIAACGAEGVRRIRRTLRFQQERRSGSPWGRRGRVFRGERGGGDNGGDHPAGERILVELPMAQSDDAVADLIGEFAFLLGAYHTATAILLALPTVGDRVVLADRVVIDARRELIPDILEHPDDGAAVEMATMTDPGVWALMAWALQRLAPHQLWVLGVPPTSAVVHRGVRAVVDALERQTA